MMYNCNGKEVFNSLKTQRWDQVQRINKHPLSNCRTSHVLIVKITRNVRKTSASMSWWQDYCIDNRTCVKMILIEILDILVPKTQSVFALTSSRHLVHIFRVSQSLYLCPLRRQFSEERLLPLSLTSSIFCGDRIASPDSNFPRKSLSPANWNNCLR